MSGNFNLYSQYYDLIYQDKPYQKEAEYVSELIKSNLPGASTLLELGCGSGAHANYLCRSGYTITGIDQSKSMIREAEKKAIPNFDPRLGDISSFKLDQKFDAAISLFHVMSYLNTNESLMHCFEVVSHHLKQGGLFLFDCWFTPGVYSLKPENKVKYFENSEIQVERRTTSVMNVQKNTVEVTFDIQITDKNTQEKEKLVETHSMRHFSIPEIEFFALKAGFSVLRTEEFLTRKPADTDKWAIFFILQKI